LGVEANGKQHGDNKLSPRQWLCCRIYWLFLFNSQPKGQDFHSGIAPSQGSYKIVADGTVNDSTGLGYPPGQFSNRLILNGDETADKLFYQLEGNKLIVVSGYFPLDLGIEKTYQKY